MTEPMQLDLFGEVEANLAVVRENERAAREWDKRFERADWISPWALGDGRPAGTVLRGYRCPDPDCGEVEPTAYTLSINHGFDPTVPGHAPYNGRCIRTW